MGLIWGCLRPFIRGPTRGLKQGVLGRPFTRVFHPGYEPGRIATLSLTRKYEPCHCCLCTSHNHSSGGVRVVRRWPSQILRPGVVQQLSQPQWSHQPWQWARDWSPAWAMLRHWWCGLRSWVFQRLQWKLHRPSKRPRQKPCRGWKSCSWCFAPPCYQLIDRLYTFAVEDSQCCGGLHPHNFHTNRWWAWLLQ